MRKCLLLTLVIILVYGCGKSPEEKIFEFFQEGLDQVERYELDAALATFKKIGEIDPATPMGYFGTGLVYEREMLYYDALHVYMAITNSKPSFAPAYEGLWRILTYLELWDDASQAAAEYARLLPSDPKARLTLAEALININQYGRARKELNEAAKMGADQSVVSLIIARTYALERKFDSATTVFEAATAKSKKSSEFFSAAAAYYETIGLVDSAVEMGRLAFETAHNDFHLGLEHFYRSLKYNCFFEARQVIRRLKENGATGRTTKGMEIFYFLAEGHQTKAEQATDSFTVLYPQTVSGYVYDMIIWSLKNEILTGIQNIDAIIHMMQTGKYDQEYQDFMKYWLAVTYARYLNDPATLRFLDRVPGMYANRKEVRLRTAVVLLQTGQDAKFEETMALLSQYHGSQPDWLTGMADVYRLFRKYEDADKYYRQALQYDTWYRPAFVNMIDMYRQLKQPKKALTLFATYAHFEQQYPEISLLKSICLVESDSIQEGISLFEQHVGQVRGNLTRFTEMTTLLDKKNRQQEVAQLYRQQLQINRDNPDALVLAAEYECDHKRFDTTLSLAEEALTIEPESVSATVQKARALYGLGKRTEAFDIFETNLKVDEYNIDNNYYFSRILATEKTDLSKAVNLASRAVFDASQDLKTLMNLCYVYYQSGRYDLSRGEATKAIQKYAEEPEPYFRVGMAMHMEGKEEAKANLQKAIDLGLKGELLETARQTLGKL
jgi:tetratricopeptide (TPR) repeat protein